MGEPTTLDADIAAFAAAVRKRLDDLPADEIEDLTGGLEADLLDQAADGDDRLSLEDPDAYADELRASAGLPGRDDTTRAPLGRRIRTRFDSLGASIRRSAESSTLGNWLLGFLLSLRPVWWVFRGWVSYQILAIYVGGPSALVPNSMVLWLLLLAVIVVSVQWGRGRWVPGRFMRVIRVAVSVVVILLAPFLAAWTVSEMASAKSFEEDTSYLEHDGLRLDGEQVINIFAYDAEGNPLTDVQLFDQDGNPLVTVGASRVDEDYDSNSVRDVVVVPREGHPSGTGWNVYPLREAPWDDNGPLDVSEAEPATPPFRTVYPLQSEEPSSTPTPAPTPMPTPTPEPSTGSGVAQ